MLACHLDCLPLLPALDGGQVALEVGRDFQLRTRGPGAKRRLGLEEEEKGHGILDCRQQSQHFRGFAVRLSASREHWMFFFW